jgi:Skp family chaperone for outer membrane proteins
MKGFRFFIVSLIFVLILSALASAQMEQTSVKTGKVAVIDTYLFYDETRGIKKLVEAKKIVYSESSSNISSLDTQINDLQKEIDSLIAQNKSINEAYLKLDKLVLERNGASRKNQDEIIKRHKLFLRPVYEEIKKKAKDFAELKGYSIIVDKSEVNFLVEGEVDDITSEFIQFCNDAFDKEKGTDK